MSARRIVAALLLALSIGACTSLKANMDNLVGTSEGNLIASMDAVPSSNYTMDDGTKLLRWDFRRREFDGDESNCTVEWMVKRGRAVSYRFRGNHCW